MKRANRGPRLRLDRPGRQAFGEFQNLFNVNSIIGFTNTVVETDSVTGLLTEPIPDFRTRGQSVAQESRQFQIGVKFIF